VTAQGPSPPSSAPRRKLVVPPPPPPRRVCESDNVHYVLLLPQPLGSTKARRLHNDPSGPARQGTGRDLLAAVSGGAATARDANLPWNAGRGGEVPCRVGGAFASGVPWAIPLEAATIHNARYRIRRSGRGRRRHSPICGGGPTTGATGRCAVGGKDLVTDLLGGGGGRRRWGGGTAARPASGRRAGEGTSRGAGGGVDARGHRGGHRRK
jgi:hypothetical protein